MTDWDPIPGSPLDHLRRGLELLRESSHTERFFDRGPHRVLVTSRGEDVVIVVPAAAQEITRFCVLLALSEARELRGHLPWREGVEWAIWRAAVASGRDLVVEFEDGAAPGKRVEFEDGDLPPECSGGSVPRRELPHPTRRR